MTLKSIQKTLFTVLISLLATTPGYAADKNNPSIPETLQGFWKFQTNKKSDWNGIHIGTNYAELWYNLAKLQKMSKTEKGYVLEVDNLNTADTIQIKLLPSDSAVFTIRNKEYRCKRYTTNPDIELLPEEKYSNLFPEKWYKRDSDKLQPLDWKNGTFQLDGKTWRVVWFGDYQKKEYRSLIECNGEYNLAQINIYKKDNLCRIIYNQNATIFTTKLTEDRSVYLADNTVFFADSLAKDVQSISMDFEVKNHVAKNIKLCVSPLCPIFQKAWMQAAVSSQTERIVNKIVEGDTICDNGGLLSRFGLLDTNLMQTAKGGVKFSGLHDGLKYITVRNKIKWDKGQYRVRLFKSGYIEGKPLFHDSLKYKGEYPINEYEHTWVTMTFEDLQNHKKWTIGSVAVPGKTLNMDNHMWLFLEIYGTPINFIGRDNPAFGVFYKDIPTIKVIYKNLHINDKKVPFERVRIENFSNQIKTKMGRAVWNKEKGEVECEIGYKE